MKVALIALSSALLSFTVFAQNNNSVEQKIGQAVTGVESKDKTTTSTKSTDKTMNPLIPVMVGGETKK